jgi:LTXXQ motif family protein
MLNLPCRSLLSAVLLATLPAGITFAQAPGLRERASPDTIARLEDGRIAMAKAALRLSDTQAKLWAPLEEQIRASLAARAKARQEREQARREDASRQDLAERLEQASQRMTQRAERMKAFTAAFKNLYATLSDEQKPLARLVLRAMGSGHHHGRFAGWEERSPGEHRRDQR